MLNLTCAELLALLPVDNRFMALNSTLGLLDLLVIVGNLLVVYCVLRYRFLHTAANFFIASLALSDLLIGILVLPFSIAQETLGFWIFGNTWCQIWLALDVWMCTASIYNLVAISLDRYLAVSRPIKYKLKWACHIYRSFIPTVWILSFIICSPPLITPFFKGQDEDRDRWKLFRSGLIFNETRSLFGSPGNGLLFGNNSSATFTFASGSRFIMNCGPCIPMNNSPGYILFSGLCSFFLPTGFLVLLNSYIYRKAKQTTMAISQGVIRSSSSQKLAGINPGTGGNDQTGLRIHKGRMSVSCESGADRQINANSSNGTRGSTPGSGALLNLSPAHHRRASKSSTMTRRSLRLHSSGRVGSVVDGSQDETVRRNRGNRTTMGRNSVFGSSSMQPALKTCRLACLRNGSVPLLFHGPRLAGISVGPVPPQVTSDGSQEADLLLMSRRHATTEISPTSFSSASRSTSASTLFHHDPDSESFVTARTHATSPTPAAPIPENQVHRRSFIPRRKSSVKRLYRRITQAALVSKDKVLNTEVKAAITVSIVVGCFVICWLPFSIIYLLEAFDFCNLQSGCLSQPLFSTAFWLGYFNSALNPLIYAVFSRDLKRAFAMTLGCRPFPVRSRRSLLLGSRTSSGVH